MPEEPFEQLPDEYDAWYDRHQAAYRSELAAIRPLLGSPGRALEVGVGTARFAAPLGIRFGIDPAEAMARRARDRGVRVARAVGERLPFPDRCFDAVLIALTLCFFTSPEEALAETARVLRTDGRLVLAFLDPSSPSGRRYRERSRGPFYEGAEFRKPGAVERLLADAGFRARQAVQTITRLPDELDAPEEPRAGTGSGLFVVVEAGVP